MHVHVLHSRCMGNAVCRYVMLVHMCDNYTSESAREREGEKEGEKKWVCGPTCSREQPH